MSLKRSFKTELGKNTAKWVSNKVFGNYGWSTPRRVIIESEKLKRQKEGTIKSRLESEKLQKHRKNLSNNFTKESILTGRNEIEKNKEIVREHELYLDGIQSIHETYSEKFNWIKWLKDNEPSNLEPNSHSLNIEDVDRIVNKYKFSVFSKLLFSKKELHNHRVISNVFKFLFLIFIVLGLLSIFFILKDFKGLNATVLAPLFFFILAFISNKIESDVLKKIKLENELKHFSQNQNPQEQGDSNYEAIQERYKVVFKIHKGIKTNDINTCIHALNLFNPFSDIEKYIMDTSFKNINDKLVINIYLNIDSVVPKTYKKLEIDGMSISESLIPNTRHNDFVLNFTSSLLIKILRETFYLLIYLDEFKVNIYDLNSTSNDDKLIIKGNLKRGFLDQNINHPKNILDQPEITYNFNKSKGFENLINK